MTELPTESDNFDAGAQLIGFVGGLTRSLLPPAEGSDLLILFSLLSSLALKAHAGPGRRAALCSDGTPVELSLSFDDRGHHALRFVCDIGTPPEAWDGTEAQWYRELADKVTAPFDGRPEMLDRLFEVHLANAPASARFKVWFGGGAAPGVPMAGLVYFNTEWLGEAALAEILTPLIGEDAATTYLGWASAVGVGCAGIAYDFDRAGLRKTKLYLRLDPARIRDIETTLAHFPGRAGTRLSDLLATAFGDVPVAERGGAMLALGFSATSPGPEASVYAHLESWGFPHFTGLAPVVQRLLGRWGVGVDGDLGQGPEGCDPTLLSLSRSHERERLAIYFKPRLAGLAPAPVETAAMRAA